MSDLITSMDRFLDRARRLSKFRSATIGTAGGYLLGLIAAAQTDSGTLSLRQLLRHNLLENPGAWAALVILGIGIVGPPLLDRYARNRGYAVRLARFYEDRADALVRPFQHRHIAWGTCMTLQSSPNIQSGWSVHDIHIRRLPAIRPIDPEDTEAYRRFMSSVFEARHLQERTRLMVIRNPAAFSDAPELHLEVQDTKWSAVQFYHRDFWSHHPHQRTVAIKRVVSEGSIAKPNSLCLHLVVATSDNYILLTQSSEKVDYYPNAWACSIGEQLDPADFTGDENTVVRNWVARALREELSLTERDYSSENVRAMAVCLEAEIVNIALVSVVVLDLSRTELEAVIRGKHPRADYEFRNWAFISWDDLPGEMLGSKRISHPSSGIRMFYAGVFRFGAPEMHRRLMVWRQSHT